MAAETERLVLLAGTNEEMTKLRAEAEAAISRDCLAMENAFIEQLSHLSAVELAARKMRRQDLPRIALTGRA
jgi:hypothetical protein